MDDEMVERFLEDGFVRIEEERCESETERRTDPAAIAAGSRPCRSRGLTLTGRGKCV
jgi:hypothetical protein